MKIVAIKERSAGNALVGDMWLETGIFAPTTPVGDIVKWADGMGPGKLILTTAQEVDSPYRSGAL